MVEVLVKKLLIIIFLTIVIFLVACQQETEDLREIENATLIEKKDIGEGVFPSFVFIFEKDKQSIQLYAKSDGQYDSFFEGTVVDVSYDADNYTVEKIYLVELEKEVKEDEK